MVSYLKNRKHFDNRLDSLKANRSAFEPEWQEISKFLAPDTGCFDDVVSGKNKKRDPYYKENVNTLPMYYINNLATAMVSNLTPSRLKWFKLSVEDESRDESIWLNNATERMHKIFAGCGLYEKLYNSFKEAILYGPNMLGVQGDFEKGLSFLPTTVGEYWVEEGHTGLVDTCYRKFAMTNIQLYRKFKDSIPERIKRALDNDNTEELHPVIHAVERNPDYLPSFKNYKNKPYISAYYLEDGRSDEGFLELKGLSYFPYMSARWDRNGRSAYGIGIGRQILGDVKSLQAYEKDLAKASKKKIDPPLKARNELRNAVKDASANGITYTDSPDGFTNLYNVNYETREALENIARISQRIYQLTYNDLFYALLNKDKSMSATEAQGIQQEKLAMLGSVVERLQSEFLKNLVESSFVILYRDGWFGAPPESLIRKDLKVEYTSLLAMSQDINDLGMIERFLRFVSGVAAINPDAARKPDVLSMCDFYASRLGLDLSLVVPTNIIAAEKQQEQAVQGEIQQQQMQNEALVAQAKAAKDLSQAQTNAGGALQEMLGG